MSRINPSPGRPRTSARYALAEYYGIPLHRAKRITPEKLEQLRLCKTEEARRLIIFGFPWVRKAK